MARPVLFENYIYNFLFQIFRIISPVITIPYITRVLDSEGIGAFTYTNSIANIFTLIGMLGINIYGSKVIAYHRDNFEKRSELFWELFILTLLTNLIALGFYLVFVQFSEENFRQLYYIQASIFFVSMCEIAWFFLGLEDFKKTSIRLFLSRVIGILAIFIFVKTREDLSVYTFIISFHSIIGCIFLWPYMKGKVKFLIPKFKNIFSHFVPNFIMFIPLFAVLVFSVVDKIMIGNISGIEETGIYEMADKLIKIAIPLAISLSAVMLPRVVNSIANKDYEKINFYMDKSFAALSYLAIPVTLGIIAIADEFIPWFMGEAFQGSSVIVCVLSFTIILNAWKSIANVQILIPFGRELMCAGLTFAGLIIKILLNLIFIPLYDGLGAAVSTLITEIVLTGLFIHFALKYINIKSSYRVLFVELVKFTVAGLCMFLPVKLIGIAMGIGVITTFVQAVAGMLIYLVMVVVLKSSTHTFVFERVKASVFKNKEKVVLNDS